MNLTAIHDEARREFDRAQAASRDERQLSISDRRFVSVPGGMWEDKYGEQFANKPKLEINKAQLALIKIYNEYRNNRITVDFVAKDGATDTNLADTCDGLFRADEQDSGADEAYDNAFEEGTSGGMGAVRLRACYEDEEDIDSDRQRVRIEPIYDADTCVVFDCDAKRYDKRDATRCWVLYAMDKQSYKDEHGDDCATWPKDINTEYFDWSTPDVVYLAEYYVIEHKRETVIMVKRPDGSQDRISEDDLEEAIQSGATIERRKTVKIPRVHKYIMNGMRVLEDCGYVAGKHIPIVPYYGKRWFIDGKERFMGHVRLSKDPAMLVNMQISRMAEIAALSPIRKPIFVPEQMAGNQQMWSDDTVKNYPYLIVNPIEAADGSKLPAGPVGYTEPPNIPEAVAAVLQISNQFQDEVLGFNRQGEEMVSNISGKAVEMIQQRQDMQAFIYLSNWAKTVKRIGEVWLGMAKELYHEPGRKMKSIGQQGDVSSVEMSQEYIPDEGGMTVRNDLSKADFDVTAQVGPSSVTRRDAMVRSLIGVLQMTEDPADRKIVQSLILMNMDGEGLGDVQGFYRKQLVQLGVLQPNEEEKAQMEEMAANAQPDPNAIFLQSEAIKNQALAVKAEAETEYTLAKTEGEKVDTLKTMSEIGAEPFPA